MTRLKLTRFLTLLILIFTTAQGSIVGMPIQSELTKTIVSAVLMFIVVALTALNQYFSVEIRNGSIWPTLIIALLAILGGLNSLIDAVPISLILGQWLRFFLTLASAILNIASKTLFPSPEGKQMDALRTDLEKKP